jgi:hypothetical protein
MQVLWTVDVFHFEIVPPDHFGVLGGKKNISLLEDGGSKLL